MTYITIVQYLFGFSSARKNRPLALNTKRSCNKKIVLGLSDDTNVIFFSIYTQQSPCSEGYIFFFRFHSTIFSVCVLQSLKSLITKGCLHSCWDLCHPLEGFNKLLNSFFFWVISKAWLRIIIKNVSPHLPPVWTVG